MHLDSIHVYPIKSCGGVSLEHATLVERGLEHDRRFMLVDENGRFVTLRTEPRLPFVALAIRENGYGVRFPDGEELLLPRHPDEGELREVTVWGDTLRARVLPDASAAFSRFLGRAVSLVHQPDETVRPVKPSRARPSDQVSLADAYPLLLMSRASVDDLSARVGRPMDMRRFRPNLVFRGGEPYMEDFFAEVRIGEVTFRGPKGCSRCVATTIDPEDGTKSVEPLRTLAKYRRSEGEVYLGMNLLHDGPGSLSVGDPLTVIREHAERALGAAASSGS